MKKLIPICTIILLSVVCLSIYGKEDKKEEFKANTIKENDNKFTIAAYVNGIYSDTIPTESKYFGYVECTDNSGNKLDTLGFVEWENNKWNVRITDITKASTCNVYFIDPPAHWLDAESGTLLRAIKDNNKVENVKTIPGKQINLPDEAELSGTIDDYGTSYYFRGNVQNNYVQFADKCWKIVRVDGNGNIRLWLWNNADDCTVNNIALVNSAFNKDTLTYIKSDSSIGYLYQTASGIGFMYGNPTAPGTTENGRYISAQANDHKSTILEYLETWYGSNINIAISEDSTTKYSDYLVDVIWCSDKSLATDSPGKGYAELNGTTSYFSARQRLVTLSSAKPTLICSDTGNDNLLSKYTVEKNNITKGNGDLDYPIGLITADEVAFAGGAYNVPNSTYYMYTNSWYWTMTPYNFNGSSACIWRVINTGRLHSYNAYDSGNKMRPSIALNYNVQTTYDKTSEYEPGTVNNPYIVN